MTTTDQVPAILGGPKAFPEGLPLVRPTIPDIPGLTARIGGILESGMLTNGRTVAELEERAAELLDVPHVVAVSSCTAGLMLVLQAHDARGPVVMPSFTFAARPTPCTGPAEPPCGPRSAARTSPSTRSMPPSRWRPRRCRHDRDAHLRHAMPGRGPAEGRGRRRNPARLRRGARPRVPARWASCRRVRRRRGLQHEPD